MGEPIAVQGTEFVTAIEECTPHLRWVADGISIFTGERQSRLQQLWLVKGTNVHGHVDSCREEWRDVPYAAE